MVDREYEQRRRLDRIAEHLSISSRYGDDDFESDVIAACLKRVNKIVKHAQLKDGEALLDSLAQAHQVRFEEVNSAEDIERLERKYLEKKEIGLGQLSIRFEGDIDALLFKREFATKTDKDRYVAVLNLTETRARAYWSKAHELVHRIAEPAQRELPFQRHRMDTKKPVERLVDTVAAEIAFYAPIFKPIVDSYAFSGPLSMAVIQQVRQHYAPTASVQATANAVVKHWPRPAIFIRAEHRSRKGQSRNRRELRVAPHPQPNALWSDEGVYIIPNMRIPPASPIYQAKMLEGEEEGMENLGIWETSHGGSLQARTVFTSAMSFGSVVYAVMSELA